MSTAKLTLRPPPNVEFVQGYPGIPPGPDRQQAAVKGSIELRAGHQGIRAKWVRIELRKVETLPGGGQANTFYDFVGQSPVNVWQTSEEYGLLQTQDFPFYIRIPESIPPSLSLEKGAGVKYELVAQVCIKAKKGFLRRDKSTILSTSSPIIIDKHELHTTWPLYQQSESRRMSQEGVLLIVDRNGTCYGPGDRVSVMATLKSDSLQTIILRGFEFSLRETTVFRAGGQATGKRAAPQTRVSVIGEQKVPVNATLYGGTQHRAELTCLIPQHHTTATLASARHIDITYVLSIKALMGTGKPLTMELPVVISNWPRNVSIEAVRRIGPTANLSLVPAGATHAQVATTSVQAETQAETQHPSTVAGRPADPVDPGRAYNTMPVANPTGFLPGRIASPPLDVDDFGRHTNGPTENGSLGYAGMNGTTDLAGPSRAASPPAGSIRASSYIGGGDMSGSVLGRNPRGSANPNRFTITNIHEDDDVPPSSIKDFLPRPGSRDANTVPSKWATAEEEKRRLYESAQANVARVQGAVARGESPPPVPPVPQVPQSVAQVRTTATATSSRSPWLTAEEEKMRLYNQAQAQAQRTQGYAGSTHGGSVSGHGRTPSDGGSDTSRAAAGAGMSSGAALYQQAISAMNRNANANLPTPGGSGSASGSGHGAGSSSSRPQASSGPSKHFASADEEKAMLRRYEDAKAAVDRSQAEPYSTPTSSAAPISAYEAIYSPTPRAPQNMPPSFSQGSSSSQPLSAYEEKERLRRQYESQDQATQAPPQPQPYANGAHAYPSPAPTNGYPSPQIPGAYGAIPAAGSTGGGNPLAEKEMLRRKYEAEDAAAALTRPPTGPPPMPPAPRAGSLRSPGPRSPPLPPPSVGGTSYQPLSAAEEKARLRAQYAAEDGAVQQGALPPPPPLMPRPPPDYIQQTRAEDVRLQLGHDGLSRAGSHVPERTYTPMQQGVDAYAPITHGGPDNYATGGLSRSGSYAPERAYTPMNHQGVAGYEQTDAFAPSQSRPPLPPKVPMH